MYLDANFLFFAAVGESLQAERARALIQTFVEGRRALTSVLALDETIWVLRKNGYGSLIRQVIEEIYAMKSIEVKEVPVHIPLRALDFIEKHNLKPRDAFHVAIMEHFNEHEIVSDDKDFDKIPGIKRIKI